MDTNEVMNQNISEDPLQIYLQIFLYIFFTLSVLFILYILVGLFLTIKNGIFSSVTKRRESKQILEDNTKSSSLFFNENKKYLQDNNNYLTIEDDIGNGSLKGVIFGVFFLGMGVLIYYKVMPYFGIFFALFGMAFIIQTILIEYNKHKYKQVDLKLYKPGAVLGNTLRGYVTISTPLKSPQFLITLENIHFYQVNRSNGEDGHETVNRESKVWSKTVKGYTKDTLSNVEVHFNIDIPPDMYPSGSLRKNEYGGYYWLIVVKEQNTSLISFKRVYTIDITIASKEKV